MRRRFVGSLCAVLVILFTQTVYAQTAAPHHKRAMDEFAEMNIEATIELTQGASAECSKVIDALSCTADYAVAISEARIALAEQQLASNASMVIDITEHPVRLNPDYERHSKVAKASLDEANRLANVAGQKYFPKRNRS